MNRHELPARPLVVILGSTGTGKSELAVELALRHNGEVINADAMQLYRGLPIVTNKISVQEQRGVPHHLLGSIGLSGRPWVVGRFKNEANRVIQEIRSRGRLPIVVGGTNYYIDGLLFKDTIISYDDSTDAEGAEDGVVKNETPASSHPILNGTAEEMYAKLKEVDPVRAAELHPNNDRRIQRALELYLTTGRKASDMYAEQRERRAGRRDVVDADDSAPPWQTLIFWIYSSREVLDERLNARVGKMLEAGLLSEATEMLDYLQQQEASGKPVDRTKGIWQSIGMKEFEKYLRATKEGLDGVRPQQLTKLYDEAVEKVQTATRQYARSQQGWIRMKMFPLLKEERALGHFYLLDSSNLDDWQSSVVDKAASVTGQYLSGEERPPPTELSHTAQDVLSEAGEASERKAQQRQQVCATCNKTLMTEREWTAHLRSKKHRYAVAAAKRNAALPAPEPEPGGGVMESARKFASETGLKVQSAFRYIG